MKQEVKKLLILNLPYLLFVYLFDKIGAAIRLTPGADASEKPRRSAYRHCGGGHYPACRLHERQEREEVPKRHGIRFCTLWCIILTVRKTMWTQEVCT